ncbi:MAG: hypothetical protein U0031_11525 [Thermomicrobiales bacterium]
MSELTSLHPYDPAFVARYVAVVRGNREDPTLAPAAPRWLEQEIARARRGYQRAILGEEIGANQVSYGLGRLLRRRPSRSISFPVQG